MREPKLEPMPLWQSWSLFLGLGTTAFMLLTLGTPKVAKALDLSKSDALMATNTVLFVILGGLALTFYLMEGRELTWSGIKSRFRIENLSRRNWGLVALGVLIVDGSYIGLQVARQPIASLVPEWMKNPYRMETAMDHSGDYVGLLFFTGLILFNVISEEMLWRGYILPRQELQHGKRAWWIHGLQWTCFHWFKPWDLIALLPGALVYGWLSTRTRSMVPGLVLHIGLNGLGILMFAFKVFK
jgi:membrane protease YdiL (CAAX protease family)